MSHRGLAVHFPGLCRQAADLAAAVVVRTFWAVGEERMKATTAQEFAHTVAGLSPPKFVSPVAPHHQDLRVIEPIPLRLQCLLDTTILRMTAK